MRLKPLLIPLALAGSAGLASQSALAGDSGYVPAPQFAPSLTVRIGAAYMEADDSVLSDATRFSVTDPAFANNPLDVYAADYLDLDNDTTWQFSAALRFMEHWGVELYYENDASLEANINSRVTVTDAANNVVFDERDSLGLGDFDTSVTSLYANWYPLDPSCLWQPYVGVGVNYTDIEQEFLRPVTNGVGLLDFGSSFSWTAQVGVDLTFGHDSNWLVNASAMYIDADPELHLGIDFVDPITGDTVPIRIRDDMKYDSWIFNLGVGYRFDF